MKFQNFQKTKVRLEISTFKIQYRQNFVKIRKLIYFGPKCPNFGIWAQKFRKPMSNLKSAPSKQGTCETRNFVKIRKFTLFGLKFPNFKNKNKKRFHKQIINLKSAHSKQGTCEISLRLESQYFLPQNAEIWAFGLKI